FESVLENFGDTHTRVLHQNQARDSVFFGGKSIDFAYLLGGKNLHSHELRYFFTSSARSDTSFSYAKLSPLCNSLTSRNWSKSICWVHIPATSFLPIAAAAPI